MTSSIKWEPIEDIKAVRDLVERSFLSRMPGLRKPGPPTDLYETDDAFVAEMDVPGLATDDIDLSMTGSQLTIEIERQAPEGRIVVFQERFAGKMARTIDLPAVVDADQVRAKLQNGVLVLTMPKRRDASQVKIGVSPAKE
jgi:HSP20 family protein